MGCPVARPCATRWETVQGQVVLGVEMNQSGLGRLQEEILGSPTSFQRRATFSLC